MKKLVLKIWGYGTGTSSEYGAKCSIEHWIVDIEDEKDEFMRKNNIDHEDFDENEFDEWFYNQFEDTYASITLIDLTPENIAKLKEIAKGL